MKRISLLFVGMMILLSCSLLNSVQSAEWPAKPIKITIAFGAGGTTDMSTRMLASLLEEELGQTVLSENKPGGGGATAASLATKQRPDGYNFFTLVTAAGTINPHRQKLPYNPLEDFAMVSRVGQWHYALAVKADSPFKTFEDLLNHAKANPGEVSYGISGVGTSQHLVMEWLKVNHDVDWTAIPFKGGAEAVTAAMGNHVTAMAGVTEWLPQVKSGDMRLLVVFDEKRMKEFPDVPTLKELGYDIAAPSYLAIATKKGVPPEIIETMDKAIAKAVTQPKFVELMDKIMVKIAYLNHSEFTQVFEKTYEEVGDIMKKAGLSKK